MMLIRHGTINPGRAPSPNLVVVPLTPAPSGDNGASPAKVLSSEHGPFVQ